MFVIFYICMSLLYVLEMLIICVAITCDSLQFLPADRFVVQSSILTQFLTTNSADNL